MQKFLMIKLTVIGVLCVIFMIVLAMIKGLVYERKAYETNVLDEIAATQIGKQTLTTPFIVVENNGKYTPIVPTNSEIAGELSVKNDQYARGIYRATSYSGVVSVKQSFLALASQTTSTPNHLPVSSAPKPPTAMLVIPVSDLRGVSLPTVTINGKTHPAKFGNVSLSGLGNSRDYLMVGMSELPTQEFSVNFELSLAGLSGVGVIPLGDNHKLNLSGNWMEPKFFGNALPVQKTLNETGFLAEWQTPFLSQQNNIQLKEQFTKCEYCSLEHFQELNTDFVNMDNVYTKTDRTIKYALILLLVSFGTFFLFEVIKAIKIHPIQYLLVASGLLVFYVLLLSLAELIAFWQAYLVASVACVGLIAWYASFLLKSAKRSVVFGGILGGLYAGFYGVLSVGEMNLLLGSVFCFVLLFAVMFITRKIDWYALGDTLSTQKELVAVKSVQPTAEVEENDHA